MLARVSNHVHLALQFQSVRTPNFDVAVENSRGRLQLQPWLVPQSMQTPQAPARMTLSLPQTEQVMPMKMLPSATVTRSGALLAPLPFPALDVSPFPGLDE